MPDLDLVLVGGGVLVPVVGSSSPLAVSFDGPVEFLESGRVEGSRFSYSTIGKAFDLLACKKRVFECSIRRRNVLFERQADIANVSTTRK
jgi:hypothetical protein